MIYTIEQISKKRKHYFCKLEYEENNEIKHLENFDIYTSLRLKKGDVIEILKDIVFFRDDIKAERKKKIDELEQDIKHL